MVRGGHWRPRVFRRYRSGHCALTPVCVWRVRCWCELCAGALCLGITAVASAHRLLCVFGGSNPTRTASPRVLGGAFQHGAFPRYPAQSVDREAGVCFCLVFFFVVTPSPSHYRLCSCTLLWGLFGVGRFSGSIFILCSKLVVTSWPAGYKKKTLLVCV